MLAQATEIKKYAAVRAEPNERPAAVSTRKEWLTECQVRALGR